MILAGPVGGDGWLAVFAVIGLFYVVLIGTGGLLAWTIARRWQVALLGVVAFATAAWWAWIRLGVADDGILLAGYAASALVGLALRGGAEGAGPDPGDDPDVAARADRRRRSTRARSALVGVAVVALAVGTAWSGVSERSERRRTDMTRTTAEKVGVTLAASDATAAGDLALVVTGTEVQVVQADGDREDGGAELVLRVSHTTIGMDSLYRCWRYRLDCGPDDAVPDPVGCPDVTPTQIASNYFENLDGALWDMPPADRSDLDAVGAVVRGKVDFYVQAANVHIEVAWLDDRVIGIAVKAGVTDCLVTRMVPDEVDRPFDAAETEVAIDSW